MAELEITPSKPMPLWLTILLYVAPFFLGWASSAFINYMSYATKVDALTQEMTQLTTIVGDMNKKLDDGNVKYYDIDKRVSILEDEKKKKVIMDTASIAKLNLLHPAIRSEAINCYNRAVQQTPANVHPFIVATLRTFDKSNQLYALGRTVVNPDGQSADNPMGNIVSDAKAGQSWHNYGLALDFGLLIDGQESWAVDENWMLVVKLFEAAGFNSGLYFPPSIADPDHLERQCGQTIGGLMAKYVAGDFLPGTQYVSF